MKEKCTICVLPGDGIGVEVIEATLPILQKVQKGFSLEFQAYPAGAQHYKKTGEALPEKTFEAARDADAMLFGAMGWPSIRYPDGTEIAPQLDLRFRLELYAGVRPVRAIPGIPLPLADPRAKDIDLVVVRESTEGLFASRGKGVVVDDREARDTMVITRKGSERVHEFSFRLAAKRRKKMVTCVGAIRISRRATTTSTPPPSIWCAGPGTSTSSSPRTCSATSSPTRPRRSSAAWAWRLRAILATSTVSFSPATAPRRILRDKERPIRRRASCRPR